MAMALPPIPMGGIGDPQPPFFCPPHSPTLWVGGCCRYGSAQLYLLPELRVRACVRVDGLQPAVINLSPLPSQK